LPKGEATCATSLNKVESGARVVFPSHGKPKAVLLAFSAGEKPWHVAIPSDPADFGDLQNPVLEDWQ
jgi:hypothetical protein